MPNLTVTIAGIQVPILTGSFSMSERVNERASCSFTVVDTGGWMRFVRGNQVNIQLDGSTLFVGFVDSVEIKTARPSTCLFHQISCMSMQYVADRRLFVGSLQNLCAGDMAALIAASTLKNEQLTIPVVYYSVMNQGDFSGGTASNAVYDPSAANGVGGLTIAKAGTPLTVTESGSALSTGTLTNTTVSGNVLQLQSQKAILYQTKCTRASSAWIYHTILQTSYTIASGDVLQYDIWITPDSPVATGGVSLVGADGSFISDSLADQNGIYGIAQNMQDYAYGQWYSRSIDLSSKSGKVVKAVRIGQEGDRAGTYTIYVRNVRIVNGTTTKLTIFSTTQNSLSQATQATANAYQLVALKVVDVYLSPGTRVNAGQSLSSLSRIMSASLTWSANVPAGTQLTVSASIDGGKSWQPVQANAPLPNLLPGMNVSSITYLWRVTLSIVGNTPTVTPTLSSISFTAMPACATAKTDLVKSWSTQADFQAGTLSGLVAAPSGAVGLTQYIRLFDGMGDLSNATTFGGSGTSVTIDTLHGWLKLTTPGTSSSPEIKWRLDDIGTSSDFVAEFSILADGNLGSGSGSPLFGFIYRTTNWNTTPDTVAYTLNFRKDACWLTKGPNAGTTASVTTIASTTVDLTDGGWHTIRLVVQGTLHTVYFDDVQIISATDSTYSSGQVAFRNWNVSNTALTVTIDNFGFIKGNGSGSWTSETVSLSGLTTAGPSALFWTVNDPAGSIVFQVSFDGGSTWSTVNNPGDPVIAQGTTYSASVKVRATFTVTSATYVPILYDATLVLTSQYQAQATWTSPAIALSSLSRIGHGTASYIASVPANTSVQIATSLDNGATWQNVGQNGQVTSFAGSPAPWRDFFVNQLPGYNSGNAFTWNISAGTISASSYTRLYYQNVAQTDSGTVTVDLWNVNIGGALLCYQTNGTYYYNVLYDSGAQQLKVIRRAGGSEATVATAPLTLDFSYPHRLRASCIKSGSSATITAYVDGAKILSWTDSAPFGAGYHGLINYYGNGTYGALIIEWPGTDATGLSLKLKVTLTSSDPTVSPVVSNLQLVVTGPDIDPGPVLPAASFSYESVSSCIDKLASAVGYYWIIDGTGRFIFANDRYRTASVFLHENNILSDVSLSDLSQDYANAVYVLGGKDLTALQTWQTNGDGKTRSWSLPYPVGRVPTITVNGMPKTVGISGVDSGKDFYWNYGQNTISQDNNAPPLGSADVLQVQYYGLYDFVLYVKDNAEVAQEGNRESGGTGLVEATIQGNDSVTMAIAYNLANAYLSKYGQRSWRITVTTKLPVHAGEVVTAYFPTLGVQESEWLVESVDMRDAGNFFEYSCSLLQGPRRGSWADFFRKNLVLPNSVDTLSSASSSPPLVNVSGGAEGVSWGESVTVTPQ